MKTKIAFLLAAALTLGGCAGVQKATSAVSSLTVAAVQDNAHAIDDVVSLAATTDPAEVKRLCDNINERKADRNAAWEQAKTVGGGVLRLVAGVASLAGYPVAGALDMISGGVDAVEGYSAGVDAITTDSDIRCRGVS